MADISIPFFANLLLPLRSFWTPGLTLFHKEMKATVGGKVTVEVRDSIAQSFFANETFPRTLVVLFFVITNPRRIAFCMKENFVALLTTN